jgi:hypothetical protein
MQYEWGYWDGMKSWCGIKYVKSDGKIEGGHLGRIRREI